LKERKRRRKSPNDIFFIISPFDELVKSPKKRLPGESRGPEFLEITGFRLPQRF
jgi:hypothetical protein